MYPVFVEGSAADRDTLYEIAQECDTSISALVSANGQIDDPNVIRVGSKLAVPNGDDAPPAEPPKTEPDPEPVQRRGEYEVRPGDTLAMRCRFSRRTDLSRTSP